MKTWRNVWLVCLWQTPPPPTACLSRFPSEPTRIFRIPFCHYSSSKSPVSQHRTILRREFRVIWYRPWKSNTWHCQTLLVRRQLICYGWIDSGSILSLSAETRNKHRISEADKKNLKKERCYLRKTVFLLLTFQRALFLFETRFEPFYRRLGKADALKACSINKMFIINITRKTYR